MLFFISFRTDFKKDLRYFSCTDIEQQWGKISEAYASSLYEVKPVREFCHVKPAKEIILPDDLAAEITKILLESSPASEFFNLIQGRNEPIQTEGPLFENVTKEEIIAIIDNKDHIVAEEDETFMLCTKKSMKTAVIKTFNADIPKEVVDFYRHNVVIDSTASLELCMKTVNQGSSVWLDERKKRITGSICYGLYTYNFNKDPDWDNKVEKTYFGIHNLTSAMKHGKNEESNALKAYEKQSGEKIKRMGFLVLPQSSWAGYSPDGVILEKKKLVEVKCPEAGKTELVKDILPTLSYLNVDENNCYYLKKKHQYYGQVQWGMIMLNLCTCDFVIYSKAEDKCHIIEVSLDFEFCNILFPVLKGVYFNKILPYLFAKKKEEEQL